MEDLIRLVEAMGFWGWIAVIACTAIICETIAKVKKAQLKMEELHYKEQHRQTSNQGPEQQDHGEKVEINKNGIHVKDGNDEVDISWRGINVNDGNSQVHIGSWIPLALLLLVVGVIIVPIILFAAFIG